eukprot:scaffold29601_cov34-Tisochrysis_lutea.AAC.3
MHALRGKRKPLNRWRCPTNWQRRNSGNKGAGNGRTWMGLSRLEGRPLCHAAVIADGGISIHYGNLYVRMLKLCCIGQHSTTNNKTCKRRFIPMRIPSTFICPRRWCTAIHDRTHYGILSL